MKSYESGDEEILDEIGLVTEELHGKILAVGPSYSKLVSERTMSGKSQKVKIVLSSTSPKRNEGKKNLRYKSRNSSQQSNPESREELKD